MSKVDGQATIWVGTYSEMGGRGLYPLICSAYGQWTVGSPFDGASNASFGATSLRHRIHYLVDEQSGTIGAYRRSTEWSRLASFGTGGAQPCYVSLSKDEAHLAVANYGSGSTAVFPLDPATGLPDAAPHVWKNSGSGPNRERQDGPHAHCACFSPDRRWLFQVDLGTDQLLAFAMEDGLGCPRLAFHAPPGSGPRHLLFHPGGAIAFLISELASTIQLLEWEGGSFTPRQLLSTLPAGFDGDSLGGHIGLNGAGDRLYATNRGHDSIALFAFDGDRLSLLGHAPSGGSSPRHFLLLEQQRLMLVANEEGGNVTGLRIADDGTLQPAMIDLPVPGPVFLFAT